VIVGSNFDENLDGKLRISVVAAGLDGARAALDANASEQEQVEAFVAPVVVTAQSHSNESLGEDFDVRPDFEGRTLPPAHIEAADGQDHVPAEAIFDISDSPVADVTINSEPQTEEEAVQDVTDKTEEDKSDTVVEAPQSGFGSLFGWKRSAQTGEPSNDAPKEAIISSPDDHPEPAPFDDADLEIPAFLRRSANH